MRRKTHEIWLEIVTNEASDIPNIRSDHFMTAHCHHHEHHEHHIMACRYHLKEEHAVYELNMSRYRKRTYVLPEMRILHVMSAARQHTVLLQEDVREPLSKGVTRSVRHGFCRAACSRYEYTGVTAATESRRPQRKVEKSFSRRRAKSSTSLYFCPYSFC